MERVLDVYKKPYDEHFPVVCMDESPKQLIQQARQAIPMEVGQEAELTMNISEREWSMYSWQMNHSLGIFL